MKYAAWREYFERVVQLPEHEIDLPEAALIIASDEYPDLDVSHYLHKLDAMASRLRPHLPPGREPRATVELLNHLLYEEMEFSGNRENYYDPRNSYLNDVLDRRTGLPITLSIVYLALGRRLGLPLVGVGLPGNFIVKWQDRENRLLIDPFNKGEILDEFGVEALVRDTYHPSARFQAEWLNAVGSRYILVRLLNNLKGIFVHTENYERAWQIVDKLLILDPRSPENIRDMGLLSIRTGAYRKAAMFLEEYLLSHGDAHDSDQVRIYLRTALSVVERLN